MLLVLLGALGTIPMVSLASDSDCGDELRAVGFQRIDDAQVELTLQAGAKNRLSLSKGSEVLLVRELGEGTCGEASRAAVVVVSRWATSLAPSDKIFLSPKPPSPDAHFEERPPVVVKRPPPAERPVRKEPAPPPPSPPPKAEPQPTVVLPPKETAPEEVTSRIGAKPPSTIMSESPAPQAPSAPLRIQVSHLEALVGGGLGVPGMVKDTVGPVVSVDLALLFNHRLRLGLTGMYDFGGTVTLFDEDGLIRGQLEAREILVFPGVSVCFEWPVRACGGLVGGARIGEGFANGAYVFQLNNAWVTSFTGGAALQLAFIRGWFHVALDGALLLTPTPTRFGVEGLPERIQAPVVQGVFRLSLGFGAEI